MPHSNTAMLNLSFSLLVFTSLPLPFTSMNLIPLDPLSLPFFPLFDQQSCLQDAQQLPRHHPILRQW